MVMGLVSQLDPEINAWHQLEKYGQELIRGQSDQQLREISWETVLAEIQPYLDLPPRLLRLLDMAEKGRIVVQHKPDTATLRHQAKVERRLSQLSWSILSAAGMISATILYYLRQQEKDK
jgi:predicted unusual protein kinase regulating ubiquinone biosynthesis (AarF/ABC1/UbiB family)